MRKGIMAFEDMAVVPSGVALEESMAAIAETAGAMFVAGEQLDEAKAIALATESMILITKKALASSGTLPIEAVTTIAVAMEYFAQRLAYSGRITPALEDFSNPNKLRNTTASTLTDLNTLSKRLHRQITIANEGFFEKIKNALEKKFTNIEKIAKCINEFKNKETRAPVSLDSPSWARVFGIAGNKMISGDDVIERLTEISKAPRQKLMAMLKRAEKHCVYVADNIGVVSKDWERFEANAKNMCAEIEDLTTALLQEIVATKETDITSIITADSKQFAKIILIVDEMITQESFKKEYFQFNAKVDQAYSRITKSSEYSEGEHIGEVAEALIQNTYALIDHVAKYVNLLTDVENNAAFSTYKYLNASINK